MHGEVDAAVEQRFLDLLRKKALAADLGERHVLNFVAGGFYDFDARLHLQQSRDVTGLPQRELGTAGANDNHLFSRRNSLRIRSERCAPSGWEAVRRSSVMGP